MITPRNAHALALTQGKVYAFGGKHFGNHALFEWESYSIYENRWNALPALPSPLSWAFAVVHGEEIWVSGREERLSVYNYMNNCHRIINITLPKNNPSCMISCDNILYIISKETNVIKVTGP